MFKIIGASGWLTGLIIFFMPVMLIFFVGSQMAYSQVKSKFEAYQTVPEVTHLAELAAIPAGQLVMLRGQISGATPDLAEADVLIFQERPADGREVRFQEEFPLVFPEFRLSLPDGMVKISPSLTRSRVIQHELHIVAAGELTRTGFRPGDMVTVQGQWQPAASTLNEVTGISGAEKASLMVEGQEALQKVSWIRNALGLFTLVGIVLLAVQLWRQAQSTTQRGAGMSDSPDGPNANSIAIIMVVVVALAIIIIVGLTLSAIVAGPPLV